MPARSPSTEAVELSVDILARPETVWRCLTESDWLSRWLQAKATLEPRVGGAVRFDFGGGGVVEGVVQELKPNEVLAFTWGVSVGPQRDQVPVGSTLVSIRLAETSAGTRVTLRHDGLPTDKLRGDYTTGWTSLLAGLGHLAPAVAAEGGLEGLWDAWFAAWGETSAAKRDQLLERCFTADGAFRDVHVEGRGRDWLSKWIGQSQVHFPTIRLLRQGPALHMRDAVVVHWRAESADGKTVASGINHGRLTADGKLAAVEGFWEPPKAS